MSKQFAKLCSIVLTLVMLFHMLPHQILADMISTEEMEIPSGGITTETEELDTSALTVVEEVTDKRTEFSKEFKMSNGLHMATVYNSAVHYEKNGTWEEIDNTLVATVSGTDSVYTNTAGVWDITFPAQLSSNNWISVTKDGYTLRFGMAGQLTNNGAVVASEGAAAMSAVGQIGTEAFEIQAAQTTVAQVQQIDTAALRAEADFPSAMIFKFKVIIHPDKIRSCFRQNPEFFRNICPELSGCGTQAGLKRIAVRADSGLHRRRAEKIPAVVQMSKGTQHIEANTGKACLLICGDSAFEYRHQFTVLLQRPIASVSIFRKQRNFLLDMGLVLNQRQMPLKLLICDIHAIWHANRSHHSADPLLSIFERMCCSCL